MRGRCGALSGFWVAGPTSRRLWTLDYLVGGWHCMVVINKTDGAEGASPGLTVIVVIDTVS